MATKSEQLKTIIETMVRAEVRRIVPHLVKEAMSQVMGELIMESTLTVESVPPTPEQPRSNSEKRRKLTEATSPTSPPPSRAELSAMLGYGSMDTVGGNDVPAFSRSAPILPDAMIGASGNPIPLDPASVPDELVEAFSRDYSGLMKSLDKRRG